jgi:hypothetical protein
MNLLRGDTQSNQSICLLLRCLHHLIHDLHRSVEQLGRIFSDLLDSLVCQVMIECGLRLRIPREEGEQLPLVLQSLLK